ncbi:MAG: hypothetical protein KatS3mg072_2809 [Meiothermus sp.]|nr:MAG: hypothetical protein KatS3mg072_2809 [Meiothermus sp.]
METVKDLEAKMAVATDPAKREADELLVERLKFDHEFVTRLLLNADVKGLIAEAGFEPSPKMLGYVETAIKKIRTYITDQVHGLETKKEQIHSTVAVINSGNSAVDW